MTGDIEGKDPLARGGDAIERFAEMKLHELIAVGQVTGEFGHAIPLRPIELGFGGITDLQVGSVRGIAIGETGIRQPFMPGGILEELGVARFDADGNRLSLDGGDRSSSRGGGGSVWGIRRRGGGTTGQQQGRGQRQQAMAQGGIQ